VRFAQERAVYQAVSQAVSAALAPFPVQEMLGAPGWPFPEMPVAPALVAEGSAVYDVHGKVEALGQVRNTYIVARTPRGLVVADQHAAHEAVLTERLLVGGESAPLSPPVRLDLTSREAELLDAHLGLFADLGVDLEPFGGNSYRVRALPAPLIRERIDPLPAGPLLEELLEELAASRALDPEPLRVKLAERAACRAAVKAGDPLSAGQQQALLDDLLAAWSPSTCPHGRPALFVLTVEEMERRFLRR
jgi:DNA mismatch repair protein MutL